jgi:hypothetical protein
MPSRLGVGLIVLFWLATTGYVVEREVLPRLGSDAAPAIRIDLSDEATQTVPARWSVWRGTEKVGSLTTRMEHVREDDTFQFISTYSQIRVEVAGVRFEAPQLTTTIRVGRAGDLRAQRVHGKLAARFGPFDAAADLDADGTVRAGELRLASPFGDQDEPLEPVPVPAGQVLNPLQPVNRLRDVRPGRRWQVYLSDPLADAAAALVRRLAKSAPGGGLIPPAGGDRGPLLAEVAGRPELLARSRGEPVECRVIDYRGNGAAARTWVAVEDGKVLRQEATAHGDTLRLERED